MSYRRSQAELNARNARNPLVLVLFIVDMVAILAAINAAI